MILDFLAKVFGFPAETPADKEIFDKEKEPDYPEENEFKDGADNEDDYTCDYCDYSSSEQGVKIHEGKVH